MAYQSWQMFYTLQKYHLYNCDNFPLLICQFWWFKNHFQIASKKNDWCFPILRIFCCLNINMGFWILVKSADFHSLFSYTGVAIYRTPRWNISLITPSWDFEMCFMGKCHNPIFQTHDIFEHMASNILIYKLESENIKKTWICKRFYLYL